MTDGVVKIRNAKHKSVHRRWMPSAIAIRVAIIHVLTCIILIVATKYWARLNTIRNLRYYQRLMAGLRKAIEEGKLESFVTDFFYQRQGVPFLL